MQHHSSPLIAANWKMHPAPQGAFDADAPYRTRAAIDVVVFPSALDIAACVAAKLTVGAQCGRPEVSGAFTGDIGMAQIAAAGCRFVLCGHSERRAGHGETDAAVALQVIGALEAGLHPVVCVGETEDERTRGTQHDTVARQIAAIPTHGDLTIAYEPVWAIGSGTPATPDIAQDMHAYIRNLLPEERRNDIRILYGGSVKPENADLFASQADIDGALVGGASLDPAAFAAIIHAFSPSSHV